MEVLMRRLIWLLSEQSSECEINKFRMLFGGHIKVQTTDLELIKEVYIKQFSNFVDRDVSFPIKMSKMNLKISEQHLHRRISAG